MNKFNKELSEKLKIALPSKNEKWVFPIDIHNKLWYELIIL